MLTNLPPAKSAMRVELEWRQIWCSPGVCDVKVKRPSEPYCLDRITWKIKQLERQVRRRFPLPDVVTAVHLLLQGHSSSCHSGIQSCLRSGTCQRQFSLGPLPGPSVQVLCTALARPWWLQGVQGASACRPDWLQRPLPGCVWGRTCTGVLTFPSGSFTSTNMPRPGVEGRKASDCLSHSCVR